MIYLKVIGSFAITLIILQLFKPSSMSVYGAHDFRYLAFYSVCIVFVLFSAEKLLRKVIIKENDNNLTAKFLLMHTLTSVFFLSLILIPIVARLSGTTISVSIVLDAIKVIGQYIIIILPFYHLIQMIQWPKPQQIAPQNGQEETALTKDREVAKSNTPKTTIIPTSDKSEFSLDLNALILLKAADNYVEVIFLQEDKIEKSLIRSTLSNIEEQLGEHLIRLHRSYLVNPTYIEKRFSKDNKQWIKIQHLEQAVPLSKSCVPTVESFFETQRG